ncbi:NADPH-ferrihemoprotein reductase [Angomonas deanei]|nr:NADPH-ferrihemoprotein reductase [Angomonas deanei]|eukprot:EPY37846.1 NADPH-ferrihemoprotein reductase [Angomonas deanei]
MSSSNHNSNKYRAVLALTATVTAAAVLYYRSQGTDKDQFAKRYANRLRKSSTAGEGAAEDGDIFGCHHARVKVVYGSESGNAENLAKGLVMQLNDHGIGAALVEPSSWTYLERYLYSSSASKFPLLSSAPLTQDVPMKKKDIFIFVVSTAGEGEPAANYMTLFFEILRQYESYNAAVEKDKNTIPPFRNVAFAVFGLGDSSYKYYCRSGTTTNLCLKKAGGCELLRMGFGDAKRDTTEDLFDAWTNRLMEVLKADCGIKVTQGSTKPPKRSTELVLTPNTASASDEPVYPGPPLGTAPSLHTPSKVLLKRMEQLSATRKEDGSAVHRVTFEIKDTSVAYEAGDHFGIYPSNPPEAVDRLIRLLSLKEEEVNSLTQLRPLGAGLKANLLPKQETLRNVLTHYMDLCGKPRRFVLRVLVKYCSDNKERATMEELLKAPEEGRPVPNASGTLRTVLDYMERFPSCCSIPLGHLLEIMPRIQIRYYSIGSDPSTHPGEIQLYIRFREDGLTSGYLKNRLQPGEDHVYAYVRTSTFHLPSKIDDVPMLLIGPGTGSAAMVGLCFRREAIMRENPSGKYGPCVFFFGARTKEEYFIKEEVERWSLSPKEIQSYDAAHPEANSTAAVRAMPGKGPLSQPVITLLDCAFSREKEEKVYVTNLLQKHEAQVLEILRGDVGRIYVSGDATNMAKDVDKALIELLVADRGCGKPEAVAHLRQMERDKRYQKDVY